MPGIAPWAGADVVNLMARRVLAGEQTGTRRGAVGRVGIGISENHSALGQAVDVRSLIKIRPHVAGVFPAKIVKVNEENVRPLFRLRRQAKRKKGTPKQALNHG